MRSLVVAGALAALALPAAASSEETPSAAQAPHSQSRSQQPPSPQQTPQTQPAPPAPEGPGGADAERRKLEEDIARDLGATPGQAQPPVVAPPPSTPSSPQGQGQGGQGQGTLGGSALARLLLLPDISAIGSFSGAYDSYDVSRLSPRSGPTGPKGKPTANFDELELGLQSVVDPYGRADVFISFTPDGVDVEEAYFTTLSLPGGVQLRAGKFFSPFGRQNQQHPHVWDFVDAPLASDRILAADVLSGTGVDVSWLTPLPWFAELHVAGQSTSPDPAAVDPGNRPTVVARFLQYGDVGPATTVGFGVSAARRSEATGAFRDLAGLDGYVKIRRPSSRAYLALQGELFARKFRHVESGRSDLGGYAQAVFRHDAYFAYGARYDDGPTGGETSTGRERRVSAVGIWYPSEFQRIRLQLTYDRRPMGQDGFEGLLAFEFIIGSHGAHPF
jgi:hypothetical protein